MSRVITLEDLQNYLDYMSHEVNNFTHVNPDQYVAPTLQGFVTYLYTLPDEPPTPARASPDPCKILKERSQP